MVNLSLTLLLLITLPMCAYSDVYKYRDADGGILLTDRPVSGDDYRLLKRFSLKGVRSRPRGDTLKALMHRRDALAPLIAQVANSHRLPVELVHAVVRVESAYRADAVSSKGAMGLMQLMPATAQRLGVRDAYDPSENLNGGAGYLRDLLTEFNQDLRLALAAYNAGENAVIKYGRQIPPYPETIDYVKKVIRFYRQHMADDRLAQG